MNAFECTKVQTEQGGERELHTSTSFFPGCPPQTDVMLGTRRVCARESVRACVCACHIAESADRK